MRVARPPLPAVPIAVRTRLSMPCKFRKQRSGSDSVSSRASRDGMQRQQQSGQPAAGLCRVPKTGSSHELLLK